MPAYLIAVLDVVDAAAFEEYARAVPAVVAAHGGRYLARGGHSEVFEGPAAEGRRVVVVEFPSVDAARRYYTSAEYTAVRALRDGAATGSLLITEGMP
ncbi:DUF1330 domain-containing protein [Streptomyces sp. NPDC093252]|uniref:DUF1330 domain-containing protein n=1 Tax=Streptomyces sp. NPDC093252 TaxID=3154980 RepID=UPI0034361346